MPAGRRGLLWARYKGIPVGARFGYPVKGKWIGARIAIALSSRLQEGQRSPQRPRTAEQGSIRSVSLGMLESDRGEANGEEKSGNGNR